jgi:hypothetical protein
VVVVLMGIQLGLGPATGQGRNKQGQSQSHLCGAHCVVVHRTHHIPCSLPLRESQVVLSAPRPVALKIGEVARRSGEQLGCGGDAVVGQIHAVQANVLKGSGGDRRSSAAICPDRVASSSWRVKGFRPHGAAQAAVVPGGAQSRRAMKATVARLSGNDALTAKGVDAGQFAAANPCGCHRDGNGWRGVERTPR